jgi:hypothetical protein
MFYTVIYVLLSRSPVSALFNASILHKCSYNNVNRRSLIVVVSCTVEPCCKVIDTFIVYKVGIIVTCHIVTEVLFTQNSENFISCC